MLRTIRFTAISRAVSSSLQFHVRTNVTNKRKPKIPSPAVEKINDAVRKAREKVVQAKLKLYCCNKHCKLCDNYPTHLDEDVLDGIVNDLEHEYGVELSSEMYREAVDDAFPYHRHAVNVIVNAIDENESEFKAELEIAERKLAKAEKKAGIVRNNAQVEESEDTGNVVHASNAQENPMTPPPQVKEIDEAVRKARENVVEAKLKLHCCRQYCTAYPEWLDDEDVADRVKELENEYGVKISPEMYSSALDDTFPYHRRAYKILEDTVHTNKGEAKDELEVAERKLAAAEKEAGIVINSTEPDVGN